MSRTEETQERGTDPGAGGILVAGTAIAETVVHQPDGLERRGLGGVGATIALALAEAGNEVTLVTSIGRGPEGERARELLEESPLRTVIRDSRGEAGYARIPTLQGEPQRARGRWPRASGLAELVEQEAPGHRAVITDTNMTPGELRRILKQPGRLTMINATTTRGATRLLEERVGRTGMITLNGVELGAIMRAADARTARQAMRLLGARSMLLTLGGNGWELHRQGGETLKSPAVKAPRHTDFIGCGDHAAAGAVHAELHQLDPVTTINEFISRKLEANVVRP